MPSTPSTSQAEPSWREQSAARCERVGINLYTRLTLCFFSVAVCSAATVFAFLYADVRDSAVAANQPRAMGEAVASALARAAQLDVRSEDRAALTTFAEKSLRPGAIDSITFRGADERILATAGIETTDDPTQHHAVRVAVTDEGIAWRAADAPSKDIGSVEVVVTAKTKAIATPVIGQRFAYVCAGAFAISSLLSILFLRTTFQPLREITRAAKRVATGELDTLLPATRNPLYQQLSLTVNSLVQRIRADQTVFKTREESLNRTIEELTRKLDARTAQLEAANGRLSGEIAEKEDFLRAVSHDLNAPLRNIGGMVSMLIAKNSKELSEDAMGRLERIKKNVDIETDLINELLELSRIKRRQGSLTLVETEALIWDLRGLFESDLKFREIDLVIETSLPPLYGEKARIRQIFQNLIDNAIKYMGDKPQREIRIGCTVKLAEAEFYVRDTGVGIEPEDIDKVFFIFRRGKSEITQQVPGKGVGLASVKSIVETYAGRIWVESKVNEGTTFRFTFNGKFVPAVSGQIPDDVQGNTIPTPNLAAKAA